MIEAAIKWMGDRLGKVTYSMAARLGPHSYDCSSAVYISLRLAGGLPIGVNIGNTDSLFGDLERNGWTRVTDGSRKRGDVFIWGRRGASGGAAGHTGYYIDTSRIIHCAYGYNGIHIDDHNWLWNLNGRPEVTVYRYTGTPPPPPVNLVDQIVEPGSYIKFDKIYAVNDVQFIGGIWQIRTNELCRHDFTWDENGIPAEPLVEVDADGYATPDQDLGNAQSGSRYKIPGKFYVHDVGLYAGMWLAQIDWNGLKFWVDIETATEVGSGDAGTPRPGPRPTTPPPAPVVTTKEETKTEVVPFETTRQDDPTIPKGEERVLQMGLDGVRTIVYTVTLTDGKETGRTVKSNTVTKQPVNQIVGVGTHVAPEPNPDIPPDPNNDNPKEDDMAFSPEDQEKLKIQTERVQATADEVSQDPNVQQLVGTVSEKTKLRVYIIGDTLIGLGIITPSLAVVMGWTDVVRIVALSSVCSAAGAFILTMFGIYKSKDNK